MVINIKIRNDIEEKARLLEKRKEQAIDYVKKEIDSLIERLRTIEKGLIDEINSYTNIYGELLAGINSGNCPTDYEIKDILANDIPNDFGPSVDSFNSLRKEIESFRLWKENKTKLNPFDLIPKNIKISSTSYDSISICWDKVDCECYYEVEQESSLTQKTYQSRKTEYILPWLDSGTEYKIRVRTVPLERDIKTVWSDPITVKTKYFYNGVWKECPYNVDDDRKYSVDRNNTRIVTKIGDNWNYCTVIGNTPLPINKIISWNIKILKSLDNDGSGISIGVAPFDINQNEDNYEKCRWYFSCYLSALLSGPPHSYDKKEYGPRKGGGNYVKTGDSVGVIMNTTKGELSFILDRVNLGVAYEGIPLDKPLVPCVLLRQKGDSIELDI